MEVIDRNQFDIHINMFGLVAWMVSHVTERELTALSNVLFEYCNQCCLNNKLT